MTGNCMPPPISPHPQYGGPSRIRQVVTTVVSILLYQSIWIHSSSASVAREELPLDPNLRWVDRDSAPRRAWRLAVESDVGKLSLGSDEQTAVWKNSIRINAHGANFQWNLVLEAVLVETLGND